MPNDLPDWTLSVNVVAGTVTIGNTPAVTITGTPTVAVTGTVSISGAVSISSGTVTATVSGAVTITSGTVTVTEIQRNVVVDDLGTFGLSPSTVVQNQAVSAGVANYYSGVQVHVYLSGPDIGGIVAFRVNNTTKGITSQWQTPNFIQLPIDLFFPVAFDAGDAITIDYVSTTLCAEHIHVFGLGEIPANAPRLRPDGRLPAMGTLGVSAAFANNANIITTQAGWRVLVKKAYLLDGQANSSVTGIQGTLNGTVMSIVRQWYPSATTFLERGDVITDDGLLLDVGSNVTCVVSPAGGSVVVELLYDFVR